MGIYRGPGGSTDATRNAASEAIITVEAKDTAVAAASSAQAAAGAATVSAANAAASATSAAASVATIGSSVTDAETAQAAAEAAQAAAQTAETNAETAETNAETAQAAAATSATNASNSASAAATSATNASNSASAASTSATNASNSASAASTSATNAAASYDAFDDRYLGSKSTAPTVDNDGNTLLVGALYFNSVSNGMKVWDGSNWLDAYASVSGAITAVTATAPVTSSGGSTPNIAMAAATSSVNGYLTSTDWTTFNSKGTGTVTSVAATAGTGISVSGSPITGTGSLTITNTAPDLTVALTAGTGINTSGTYPNFTITNSAPDQTVALTAGTGINTSGTYPNFTVTNSAPMTYAGAGIAVSTGSAWTTSLTAPSGALVGTTATQTLTNKTLTDPAITGAILEDIYTITDGAAFEIDPGNGSIQLITLGASRTPKATNFANGESVILMVDDGSAYTLTWTDTTFGASGVVWKTNAGVAPTLNTTGYTVIVLWEVASQVYGARVGDA